MKTAYQAGLEKEGEITVMARKIISAVFLMIITAAAAFACDMSYTLTDSEGTQKHVNPDNEIMLKEGNSYTLSVNFSENHGKCNIPPEKTVFLLNDEKWVQGKDYLPLVLENDFSWESSGSRDYTAELSFEVKEKGLVYLEVIRECDRKEGYDEYLGFKAE